MYTEKDILLAILVTFISAIPCQFLLFGYQGLTGYRRSFVLRKMIVRIQFHRTGIPITLRVTIRKVLVESSFFFVTLETYLVPRGNLSKGNSSLEHFKVGSGIGFFETFPFVFWLSFKDMKHIAPHSTTFTKHHLIYCLTFINSKSVKLKQKETEKR